MERKFDSSQNDVVTAIGGLVPCSAHEKGTSFYEKRCLRCFDFQNIKNKMNGSTHSHGPQLVGVIKNELFSTFSSHIYEMNFILRFVEIFFILEMEIIFIFHFRSVSRISFQNEMTFLFTYIEVAKLFFSFSQQRNVIKLWNVLINLELYCLSWPLYLYALWHRDQSEFCCRILSARIVTRFKASMYSVKVINKVVNPVRCYLLQLDWP